MLAVTYDAEVEIILTNEMTIVSTPECLMKRLPHLHCGKELGGGNYRVSYCVGNGCKYYCINLN